MYSKDYYIGDVKKKQDAIRGRAAYFRRAADKITLIKPIIQAFDGKIANYKFDDAVKMSSDADSSIRWIIAASHYYKRYEIRYIENSNYNDAIDLLNGYDWKAGNKPTGDISQDDELSIFTEKKRIRAGKMFVLMNDKRAELLRTAAEYDKVADNLPDTLRHIQDTANTLSILINSIPYRLCDIVGVSRIRV